MLREVRRKTVVLGGKFEDGELEIEENEVSSGLWRGNGWKLDEMRQGFDLILGRWRRWV